MLMGHRSLKVYQLAFQAAMDVYRATKSFPRDEFSLIDQLRRSSRGIAANVAEAYRKRQYPKMFSQSLSVADGELSETLVWLEFAVECGHLTRDQFNQSLRTYEEVGRMLGGMIAHPEKFTPRNKPTAAPAD
jgi:four helix bundle protein